MNSAGKSVLENVFRGLLAFDLSLHESEEFLTILQQNANDVRRDLARVLCTGGFN